MPMGNEIHYSAVGTKAIADLLDRLGVQLIDLNNVPLTRKDVENGQYVLAELLENSVLQDIDNRLERAYFTAASRMGWTYQGFGQWPYDRDHVFDTPYGQRVVSHFHLNFTYDPEEAGDYTEMASLGVALSGRYVPTFLDIQSEHGCLTNMDLMKAINDSQIAIDEIVREVPELSDLKLVLRDIFY